MHFTWKPLGFLLDLSKHTSETRFPPDVWQAFFCRSFRAPIPKMLAHAHSCTLCSSRMCIDPFGDHVPTCKQYTGSIRGHNHLMDVVASLSRDSKICPVRVNHKVSTTGDGTRKQGDVEISNFPIFLWDGLVIEVSFVCVFKGSSRAPGGWNNSVRHSNDVLQVSVNVKNNNYKEVYGLVTRRLHLPSQVCPVRSTLIFFGFSGFLLTNRCGRTMRAWARRIRSEMRFFNGQGARYLTITRLQLVGPLPLAAPPAAICLCTVLR